MGSPIHWSHSLRTLSNSILMVMCLNNYHNLSYDKNYQFVSFHRNCKNSLQQVNQLIMTSNLVHLPLYNWCAFFHFGTMFHHQEARKIPFQYTIRILEQQNIGRNHISLPILPFQSILVRHYNHTFPQKIPQKGDRFHFLFKSIMYE